MTSESDITNNNPKNLINMKCLLLSMLTLSTFFSSCWAQNKLSDKEITAIKTKMAENPECRTPLLWLEDDGRTDYYLETAPLRCPDELDELIHLSEPWHEENSRILQLEQQIYPKPGSSKSEKMLAQHFKDVEKAKKELTDIISQITGEMTDLFLTRFKEIDECFRQTFLEKGGSEEPMTLFRAFRGAEPDPGALLRNRGLE